MSVDGTKISVAKRVIEKSIHVDSIKTLLYFEFDDRFEDRFEEHAEWEMVYVDRGECTIVADDDTFSLCQGEVYFHKPYERHKILVPKNKLPNIFIISFHSTSSALHCFDNRVIQVSMSIKQYITAIIHEASLTYDTLRVNDLNGKNDNLWAGEQTILLRFELMLIELIRQEKFRPQKKRLYLSKKTIEDEFCVKIIDYLDDRIYERVTLEEISEHFSYSKSYISKHFMEVCGYSVIEYFNMMKIERAKVLVRSTNKSFFDISEMLMISNSHYFSTLFKKYVGMTPTQYKKSCK